MRKQQLQSDKNAVYSSNQWEAIFFFISRVLSLRSRLKTTTEVRKRCPPCLMRSSPQVKSLATLEYSRSSGIGNNYAWDEGDRRYNRLLLPRHSAYRCSVLFSNLLPSLGLGVPTRTGSETSFFFYQSLRSCLIVTSHSYLWCSLDWRKVFKNV